MGNTEVERVAEQASNPDDLITFIFEGYIDVRRSELRPRDVKGALVDVSGLTTEELAKRLNNQYTIALGDYLYSNNDAEIVMSDFEAMKPI